MGCCNSAAGDADAVEDVPAVGGAMASGAKGDAGTPLGFEATGKSGAPAAGSGPPSGADNINAESEVGAAHQGNADPMEESNVVCNNINAESEAGTAHGGDAGPTLDLDSEGTIESGGPAAGAGPPSGAKLKPNYPAWLRAELERARELYSAGDVDGACKVLGAAFADGIANLDNISKQDYNESTLVMQQIRDEQRRMQEQHQLF